MMKAFRYFFFIALLFFLASCSSSNYEKVQVKSMHSHVVVHSQSKKALKPLAYKEYIDLKPYLGYIAQKLSQIKGSRVYPHKALQLAAVYHAKDMAVNNHFSHRGSGKKTDLARDYDGKGSKFLERIVFFGYEIDSTKPGGEVIAYSKSNIVGSFDVIKHFDHAIKNFLKSPLHAKIILNQNFRYFGIGAYRVGNTVYWVIDFAH